MSWDSIESIKVGNVVIEVGGALVSIEGVKTSKISKDRCIEILDDRKVRVERSDDDFIIRLEE